MSVTIAKNVFWVQNGSWWNILVQILTEMLSWFDSRTGPDKEKKPELTQDRATKKHFFDEA